MKKIAFLVPNVHNKGGVARVVSIITNALFKEYSNKYEIIIIGYLSGDKKGYFWNDKLKYFTIFNKSTPLKKGIFKGTRRIRKILREEKVDITIVCDSNLSLLGLASTKWLKSKLIYWDHTNFFENTSHQFKKQTRQIIAKYADVSVVLTKADELNYKKYTQVKNIFQIYNPIEFESTKLIYNSASNKIVSVGRLAYQKNFEIIPLIAKKIKDRGISFKWHIFGEGPHKESIQHEIIKNEVSDYVVLKGHSTDISSEYNNYSILAMTSRYEGFPMVLLEAFNHKLPAISFDINTGPNEIIQDMINGFLIPENNIDLFVDKLEFFLKNITLRDEMSLNTQNNINIFKLNDILIQWNNIFEKM